MALEERNKRNADGYATYREVVGPFLAELQSSTAASIHLPARRRASATVPHRFRGRFRLSTACRSRERTVRRSTVLVARTVHPSFKQTTTVLEARNST